MMERLKSLSPTLIIWNCSWIQIQWACLWHSHPLLQSRISPCFFSRHGLAVLSRGHLKPQKQRAPHHDSQNPLVSLASLPAPPLLPILFYSDAAVNQSSSSSRWPINQRSVRDNIFRDKSKNRERRTDREGKEKLTLLWSLQVLNHQQSPFQLENKANNLESRVGNRKKDRLVITLSL
jgi:hypothetical protein